MADDDIRGLLGSVQDYFVRGGLDEDARYVLGPHAYEGMSKFASLANFIGPGADIKDVASESAKVMEGDLAAFAGLPASLAMMAVPGSKSGVQEGAEGLSGLFYRGSSNLDELAGKYSLPKEGALGGGGVYVTPDTDYASNYAVQTALGEPKTGGFVAPLNVKFDNPLIIDIKTAQEKVAPELKVLKALGLSDDKAADMLESAYEKTGGLTNQISSRAKKQGFDGIVLRNEDGTIQEAISYNTQNIRSAFEEVVDKSRVANPQKPPIIRLRGGARNSDPDQRGYAETRKSGTAVDRQVLKKDDSMSVPPIDNPSLKLEEFDAGMGFHQLSTPDNSVNLIGGTPVRGSSDYTVLHYGVADESGKNLVGNVKLRRDATTGQINGIVDIEIKPEHRKQGHAKKILEALRASTEGADLNIFDIQNTKYFTNYAKTLPSYKIKQFKKGGSVVERSNNYEPKVI